MVNKCVYAQLHDYQRALTYLNQALLLAQPSSTLKAASLNNIGRVYFFLGDSKKALHYYSEALRISSAIGYRSGEAAQRSNLGTLYRDSGNLAGARQQYDQSLRLYRAITNIYNGQANVLEGLGALYLASRQYDDARRHYDESLALRRAAGEPLGEASVLQGLARLERDRGDLSAARNLSEASLGILESLRAGISNEESRTSFFAGIHPYYDFHLNLMMQSHDAHPDDGYQTLGFDVSERARARALVDIVRRARADIREGVDSALLQRQRMLQELLTAKSERQVRLLSGKQTEQLASVRREVAELLDQYHDVDAQIRRASPRYAALTQPQPLGAREIQQQLVDAETVLLEYALSEERSYLWMVGPEAIRSFELPKRTEIEMAARHFYDLLTERNHRSGAETNRDKERRAGNEQAQLSEVAGGLSKMLLGPAWSFIKGKRLLVVADAALQYIPFGALGAPDQSAGHYEPLVAEHEVVTLPSASVLALLRQELAGRKVAPKAVAVLADPVFSGEDPRVRVAANKYETGRNHGNGRTTLDPALTRAATELGLFTRGVGLARLPFTRQEAEGIYALAEPGEAVKAMDFQANLETASPTFAHLKLCEPA